MSDNAMTNHAPCKTLSQAAGLVLGMSVSEFEQFEPRTVAEKTAISLLHRTLRGSATAYRELTDAYERGDDEEERLARCEEIIVKIREAAYEYCTAE